VSRVIRQLSGEGLSLRHLPSGRTSVRSEAALPTTIHEPAAA
jgi:hypothetical protein